jgi:outer membrane lipoprotein-sorting protein
VPQAMQQRTMNAGRRLALLLCWAVPAAAQAGEAALTGLQVMERARSVNQPHDEVMQVEMQLVSRGGRAVRRRLRIEYLKGDDGLDRTLIRFAYPRRMKGTGLLTLQRKAGHDDQWLYLPSLRRVRRIAADARTERFVQSDFTYEDLQPEDLDDNAYKLLGPAEVGDRPCHSVEARPKSASGYARRVIAVDAERWLPLRTDYFDADDERVKTQTVSGVRKQGDRFWRPDRIEMIDHRRRHTTVFVISERAINQKIDPGHFTERFLRTGQ